MESAGVFQDLPEQSTLVQRSKGRGKSKARSVSSRKSSDSAHTDSPFKRTCTISLLSTDSDSGAEGGC